MSEICRSKHRFEGGEVPGRMVVERVSNEYRGEATLTRFGDGACHSISEINHVIPDLPGRQETRRMRVIN